MTALGSAAAEQHVIWETEKLVAYLHPYPWTPGTTVVTQKSPSGPSGIFQLAEGEFLALLLGARAVGALLCDRLGVQRCALVSRPHPGWPAHIRVLPLHGLDPSWRPHLAEQEDFQPHDPGYCTSKNGPRWRDAELEQVQGKIRVKLPSPCAPPSYTFLGEPSHSGLFSRIVRGEEQQWRVWEDEAHVAFLTPFPNTPGLTVLVPRRPLSSDIFRLDEDEYQALVRATRNVAQLLEQGLGAKGVGLIFEGFEIDYAHVKLLPLIPPPRDTVSAPPPQFFLTYPGYVTSADGPVASTESLRELHTRIIHDPPGRASQTIQALTVSSQPSTTEQL